MVLASIARCPPRALSPLYGVLRRRLSLLSSESCAKRLLGRRQSIRTRLHTLCRCAQRSQRVGVVTLQPVTKRGNHGPALLKQRQRHPVILGTFAGRLQCDGTALRVAGGSNEIVEAREVPAGGPLHDGHRESVCVADWRA